MVVKAEKVVPAAEQEEELDTNVKKYLRGGLVNLEALKDKKLKGQLAVKEQFFRNSAKTASQHEKWLLPTEAGCLETEGVAKTWGVKQEDIAREVDILSRTKQYDIVLPGQATTGGGYQSMDEPNFSTQPEFLEDSPQETQHSSRGRGRGRARGGGSTRSPRSLWGQAEDMILISGFLNTSKDPIRNTNQSSASFWKRVSAYWNEHKPIGHPDRDEKSCKNRWQIINKSAQSFNGFYAKASRDRGNGESEADVITKAKSYYAAFNKKDFSYEDAWRVLKDEPKWSQYFVKEINKNNPSSGSAGSAKRSRSDVESDTLNANIPTSDFSGHTIERPEGIKAAKRKGKKAASTSCDQEDERAIEMVKIKDGWLSRAHELEMAKEARKREKQAHELAMENEQNKRAVFQQKWDLLQWMSAQTNLGEDGEAAKQKLFKELSNM